MARCRVCVPGGLRRGLPLLLAAVALLPAPAWLSAAGRRPRVGRGAVVGDSRRMGRRGPWPLGPRAAGGMDDGGILYAAMASDDDGMMVPVGPFSPFVSRGFVNLDLDPVRARYLLLLLLLVFLFR